MINVQRKIAISLGFLFLFSALSFSQRKTFLQEADIVIYGGTSAGVAAAIQSSRENKSVILIEPTNRIGGLTTGGLGRTDIGHKSAIGGISREFYENIWKYYDQSTNWKWETKDEYLKNRTTGMEVDQDAMWHFEPSAALQVMTEMLSNRGIEIIYNERLNRETGVTMAGRRIISIEMESGRVFRGKVFIDATYEGDLMAASNVSYTIGREANNRYGETLNGVQGDTIAYSILGRISKNARHHNFVDNVDPYVVEGDPSSGLLPFISNEPLAADGTGDTKIQAYCFRMTLTDHPENRVPFRKPANYDESFYELLFRNYEAAPDGDIWNMYDYGDPILPWINAAMPNRKTDTNNQKGLSTDFIGENYEYPEASYSEREKIVEAHRNYQQGLMWTLAYHHRIPQEVRDIVSQWGTCKDEYDSEDGWQDQLYIREARRMIGEYIMTQHDCERLKVAKDVIGLASYGMDSHHVQRYVNAAGFAQNEGNVECGVEKPYPISYRSITPKKGECSNLLVPVCLAASHIAFGSIRMEPVFMVLGQSAATAASLAIDNNDAVQDISYKKLKEKLLRDKQILK